MNRKTTITIFGKNNVDRTFDYYSIENLNELLISFDENFINNVIACNLTSFNLINEEISLIFKKLKCDIHVIIFINDSLSLFYDTPIASLCIKSLINSNTQIKKIKVKTNILLKKITIENDVFNNIFDIDFYELKSNYIELINILPYNICDFTDQMYSNHHFFILKVKNMKNTLEYNINMKTKKDLIEMLLRFKMNL